MQRARSFVAADIQGLIDTPRCNSPRSRGSSSPRGPEADAFYAADKELSLFNSKALRRHVISVYNHLTGAVKTSQRAARIVVPVALICLVLLVAQHLVPGTQADETQYAVFIDAGSSGTRLHVYRYLPQKWPRYARISPQQDVLKVEPGLSSYAGRPEAAAASLQPLLDFATSKVPQSVRPRTPVRLMATAGLRLLPAQQAEDILSSCREVLASSGFQFHSSWVELISGDMEGLYGWIAVNYATGALQDVVQQIHGGRPNLQRAETFQGVLEMGGASMQITFMPQGGCTPHKFAYHLRLPGLQGLLYTHSYLGYGLDMARANVTAMLQADNASTDPCMPLGHTSPEGLRGAGNYSQCYQLVSRLFTPSEEGEEEVQPEHHAQQPLHKTNVPCLVGRFLGIENFHWTARAVDLPPLATVADLSIAAQKYCSRSAEQLRQEHPPEIQEQYMLRYCFGATYIVALLDEGIGFHRRKHKLVFTNKVQRPDGSSLELDWALGAVLTHLMQHSGYSLYAFKGGASSRPRAGQGARAVGSSRSRKDGADG